MTATLSWLVSVTKIPQWFVSVTETPTWLVAVTNIHSIQFSSIKKTLIIPQGAILLWSWRACKIIIHKVERTIQQKQHHQQKSLTLTIVIDTELWHHHKIVMNLRLHTCKTVKVSHTAIKTISHTHTHISDWNTFLFQWLRYFSDSVTKILQWLVSVTETLSCFSNFKVLQGRKHFLTWFSD